MKRTIGLVLFFLLPAVIGVAQDDVLISSDILFDDACGENEPKCAFWSCYETGKCDERTFESYPENSRREVAVKRDESPKKEMGEMREVSDGCRMHESPKPSGEVVGSPLHIGRNIWTVPSVVGWKKVFRKSGPVYVRSSCFK